jgi:hypothetical protein
MCVSSLGSWLAAAPTESDGVGYGFVPRRRVGDAEVRDVCACIGIARGADSWRCDRRAARQTQVRPCGQPRAKPEMLR